MDTQVMGKIGKDGEWIKEKMQHLGVNTTNLIVDEHAVFHPRFEKSIIFG